jgi:hypothetical protein
MVISPSGLSNRGNFIFKYLYSHSSGIYGGLTGVSATCANDIYTLTIYI